MMFSACRVPILICSTSRPIGTAFPPKTGASFVNRRNATPKRVPAKMHDRSKNAELQEFETLFYLLSPFERRVLGVRARCLMAWCKLAALWRHIRSRQSNAMLYGMFPAHWIRRRNDTARPDA